MDASDLLLLKKTASAKKATLVPLLASTLSPVTSPVVSPTLPTSPNLVGSLHQLPRLTPFLNVPATATSSSFFTSSSSSSLSSLTSLTSISTSCSSSQSNNSNNQQILSHSSTDTDLTDMTVAKLDPASEGATNGCISPSAAFSPPGSPISFKEEVYSTTTRTTTRTSTASTKSFSTTTSDVTLNENDQPSSHKTRSKASLGPKMNPIYKGIRALIWALYMNLGASLISMTQVLSLPLALIAPGVYRRHISRTEGHFGALLLKMNQLFAPSDIILTGDESIRGIVKVYQGQRIQRGVNGDVKDGNNSISNDDEKLKGDTLLDMPDRMIFISNHQIYSDWMYLWCFSYFAEKHRALKIILRGDLTWIPVFG
ncbi:hypothetical protein BGZ51_007807, partial [Haplosporangium sp. Z 767]